MPLTPKQAADDAIARARAILAHSSRAGTPQGVADDLVRTALVMGVAALDTYMHSAVMRSVAAWDPTSDLRKLDVRFDEVCDLAWEVADGRRQDPSSRPWVLVKEMLRERLLRMTFQSSRAVENALGMCGVNKGWSKVAKQLGSTAPDVQSRLDSLVHRRNKIVHESDLQRAARPRRVKHEEIDPTEVAGDIDWLETLIVAVDQVI